MSWLGFEVIVMFMKFHIQNKNIWKLKYNFFEVTTGGWNKNTFLKVLIVVVDARKLTNNKLLTEYLESYVEEKFL